MLLEDKLYCYEKREEVLVFSEIIMMSSVGGNNELVSSPGKGAKTLQ